MVTLMFQPDWVAGAYPSFKQYCLADQECKDSGFITFLYAEQVRPPPSTSANSLGIHPMTHQS